MPTPPSTQPTDHAPPANQTSLTELLPDTVTTDAEYDGNSLDVASLVDLFKVARPDSNPDSPAGTAALIDIIKNATQINEPVTVALTRVTLTTPVTPAGSDTTSPDRDQYVLLTLLSDDTAFVLTATPIDSDTLAPAVDELLSHVRDHAEIGTVFAPRPFSSASILDTIAHHGLEYVVATDVTPDSTPILSELAACDNGNVGITWTHHPVGGGTSQPDVTVYIPVHPADHEHSTPAYAAFCTNRNVRPSEATNLANQHLEAVTLTNCGHQLQALTANVCDLRDAMGKSVLPADDLAAVTAVANLWRLTRFPDPALGATTQTSGVDLSLNAFWDRFVAALHRTSDTTT